MELPDLAARYFELWPCNVHLRSTRWRYQQDNYSAVAACQVCWKHSRLKSMATTSLADDRCTPVAYGGKWIGKSLSR
ncbi:hypothetical protein LMH87_000331 [Akanthomyces muscarius]|uniref:Uncharacterized protein n=1 Tax=Akanthomyces muscarius TaxID=2231603 RepID=A0A9W8QET5_AKAMU|nr:hypothetical protein LMH87_000331 [Akanthomyces muscarius]KAJ4155065.1 hypothetical protein LMH87_000331 [Akanthomyces muscarius]